MRGLIRLPGYVLMGRIGAPHGVRGVCRVASYAVNATAFFSYRLKLLLIPQEATAQESGGAPDVWPDDDRSELSGSWVSALRPVELVVVTMSKDDGMVGLERGIPQDDHQDDQKHLRLNSSHNTRGETSLLARIKGVNGRAAIDGYRGATLWVARSDLPALDEEEYYHADLVDSEVRTLDGRCVGFVRSVQRFGGGDVLDISADHETHYVAFTRFNVPDVLPTQKIVVISDAVDWTKQSLKQGLKGEDDVLNASKPEHHRTYRSTQRPHRQPARTGVGEMSEMNKMSEGSGREYRVKSGDVEVVHEPKDLASQRSTVKKRNAHRVSGDRSKADSS